MARRISFSVPEDIIEEIIMTYRMDHGEARTEKEIFINVLENTLHLVFGAYTHDFKVEDLGHICEIDHICRVGDPPQEDEVEEEEVEEEEEYEEDGDFDNGGEANVEDGV